MSKTLLIDLVLEDVMSSLRRSYLLYLLLKIFSPIDTQKKMDRENRDLGHIEIWTLFKELFLKQFLPGNFNPSMHQSMYRLRQGSMSVTEFKLKFDEHVAYFLLGLRMIGLSSFLNT
jgi:hypothetical protein